MALDELLRKVQVSDDADFLREGVRALAQALMEAEVSQHVGAGRYERSAERTGERNGHRERRWDTRVGSIQLRVPRVRDGSYFPALLEPRRRAERALVAVVQEAYVQGVSTRRVDELVQSLGLAGMSKSQVSLLCQELDGEVERFRTRPLAGTCYPYVWLDATFVKGRAQGRVVAQAVVIAIGLNAATGQREVLGLDVGPSEDGAFWLAFLRGLVARGLAGVQLVTSDAHEGLKAAIAAVLHGASGQRCRVHFVRNALALVPKSSAQLVAATIRTVFAQPEPAMARQQWRHVADGFRPRYPRLAALLDDAEADVLAYLAFPAEHWRQIWSNNPLERLNREVKRRTDVVGIFPDAAAILRLVGMILAEQHDEWQVGRRYFSAESLAKLAPRAPAGEGEGAADALTLAASYRPASATNGDDGNHQSPHVPGHIPWTRPS
jgi:transposase-like protein